MACQGFGQVIVYPLERRVGLLQTDPEEQAQTPKDVSFLSVIVQRET